MHIWSCTTHKHTLSSTGSVSSCSDLFFASDILRFHTGLPTKTNRAAPCLLFLYVLITAALPANKVIYDQKLRVSIWVGLLSLTEILACNRYVVAISYFLANSHVIYLFGGDDKCNALTIAWLATKL